MNKFLAYLQNELMEAATGSSKLLAFGATLTLGVLFAQSAFALDTAVETQISTTIASVIADIEVVFGIVIGLTLAVIGIKWIIKMVKSG